MTRNPDFEAPIRVINFILDSRPGGPHNYVKTVAAALDNAVSPEIVTSGLGPTTDLALVNLRRFWRPLYLVEIAVNVVFVLLLVWKGRLRGNNAIFAVHGAANLAPLIAARMIRRPLIWYVHETWDRYKSLARIGIRAVKGLKHRIVVISEEVARAYQIDDYLVVPPGVDLEFWSVTKQNRNARHSDDHALKILMVGNLNPLKGHDLILDALDSYVGTFSLTIAGAELLNYRGYTRCLFRKKSHLESRANCEIKFVGWQERTVIRSLLLECQVFVLPSRSEGTPIALMEAMAMERVCIAAEVSGVRKLIIDNACGIVVPVGSCIGIAEALARVQGMTDLERVRMGEKARARMEEGFSSIVLAQRHLNIYRDILEWNRT